MNSKKSGGNAGFVARISILLFLLACVGGAFAYDRAVLIPAGSAGVDRIADACLKSDASRESVKQAAGCEPKAVETLGKYELETYHFGRILPNLQGWTIDVLYKDEKVVESFSGGISEANRSLYETDVEKEEQGE